VQNKRVNSSLEIVYTNSLDCIYLLDDQNRLYFLENKKVMVLVRESVKHVTVSDDWLRVESYNNVEYVYSSLYDFENRNCIEPSLESSGVLDKDGIAKLVRNSRGC